MRRTLALVAVAAACLVGCGKTTHTLTPNVGLNNCPGYMTQYGCSAHSPTFGLPPFGVNVSPPSATSTSNRMYDSVTISVIPRDGVAVAGYLSGLFPTWGPLKLAFPSAIHVPVAIRALPVYPSLVGRMACLDVEPGDASPSEAGAWARGEIGLGVKPCIYSALKNGMAPSVASLQAAGLKRSQYFLWDADWTDSPRLDAGFDATQWTSHYEGLNVDASQATDAFLGIIPKPVLPVCFTHRETRFQCNGAKEKIASAQRASDSSGRAYKAKGCIVLAQRVEWFGDQLKHHPHTKTVSRRNALAASRRVYRQRSCKVFLNRESYFNEVVIRTRSLN